MKYSLHDMTLKQWLKDDEPEQILNLLLPFNWYGDNVFHIIHKMASLCKHVHWFESTVICCHDLLHDNHANSNHRLDKNIMQTQSKRQKIKHKACIHPQISLFSLIALQKTKHTSGNGHWKQASWSLLPLATGYMYANLPFHTDSSLRKKYTG